MKCSGVRSGAKRKENSAAESLQKVQQTTVCPKREELVISTREGKKSANRIKCNGVAPGPDGVEVYRIKIFAECHV